MIFHKGHVMRNWISGNVSWVVAGILFINLCFTILPLHAEEASSEEYPSDGELIVDPQSGNMVHKKAAPGETSHRIILDKESKEKLSRSEISENRIRKLGFKGALMDACWQNINIVLVKPKTSSQLITSILVGLFVTCFVLTRTHTYFGAGASNFPVALLSFLLAGSIVLLGISLIRGFIFPALSDDLFAGIHDLLSKVLNKVGVKGISQAAAEGLILLGFAGGILILFGFPISQFFLKKTFWPS
jgi:hypothetical protein